MVRFNLFTPRLWLLLCILLAFALRMHKLEAQSLWYDEGVTATVAQYDLASLTEWTANDIQPPLYYYVVAGWGRLTDWREWNLRFPSVWFAVLSVPLMAVLTGRLTGRLSRQRWAALLAALFTTLHPLLIYYSQEARMYSLLVALSALMGYALLRATGGGALAPSLETNASLITKPAQPVLWWITFVLATTAAAYTHYFAFFLLFALIFAYLVECLTTRNSQLATRNSQLAILTILLLYTPWFFALFTRLSVDSSYWQGEFKWWEALYQALSSFAVGETMLAQDFQRWMPIFVIALCWAFFRLVSDRHWRALSYGLIWLVIPVLSILILASINPKFNPRYTLVALPGLIVLCSVGLAGGVETGRLRAGRLPDSLRRTIAQSLNLLIYLLIIFAFTISIGNWFNNPAFTKDQWREAATYVKQHIQPDEKVVLVSGHAWPVWDYYAAALTPIRLPDIEILDVNAVLDYEMTASALREKLDASTGKWNGVWLVNWQDEVVDPTGMAALALELGGQEQPVDAQFWQVRLRHFTDIDANQITAEPPMTARIDASFGRQIKLLGYSQLDNDDLLLFWQRASESTPSPADLLIAGAVTTHERIEFYRLQERRPAAYNFPVARWQAGKLIIGRVPIGDLVGLGALPGSYQLALTVFDPAGDLAGLDVIDAQDRKVGKQVFLPVLLTNPVPGIDHKAAELWPQLQPGLHVTGTLSASQVESGSSVTLELEWYTTVSQPPIQFLIAVNGGAEPHSMVPDLIAMRPLPLRQVLRQKVRIAQTALSSGSVQLIAGQNPSGSAVEIGILTVLPSTRTMILPRLAQPISATLFLRPESASRGDPPIVTLAGLKESLPNSLTVGSTLNLNLVWQAGGALAVGAPNYHLSLQWLDASGTLVDQIDAALAGGTSTWLEGQVTEQSVSIKVPSEPGAYQLIVAVYDSSISGLPRLWSAEAQDHVTLGSIQSEP